MLLITSVKNNFLAMSKPARYIYSMFAIIVIVLTFQILSAFLTPPKVERAEETTGNVKGKSEVELQAGREVTDIATQQTDEMLELARQVDTDQSKQKFEKQGIAAENVQLASWQDESKMVNVENSNSSKGAGPEDKYILRNPKSSRLPDELADVEYEYVGSKKIQATTKATNSTMEKKYIELNPEDAINLAASLGNSLSQSAPVEKQGATGESIDYLEGTAEAYNWEVNKVTPPSVRTQEYQQKISEYLSAQSIQTAGNNTMGNGFVERQNSMVGSNGGPTAANTSRSSQSTNAQNGSISGGTVANNQQAGNASNNQSGQNQVEGRGLLPGDVLPCKLVFSINSDLSSVSACEVVRGPLKGAIIGLNVQREEEYVTLTASGITFNDYYDSMAGIAISMEAYGTTGVRSDIDRHTLSRWSSLLFAGAFDGIWELYRQPRQRTIVTDQGIVQTTEEPSDRQVLLAALSRPASILTKTAETYFERPNTIYVHRSHLVGIYIQQPFNREWLPDVSKKSQQIKY